MSQFEKMTPSARRSTLEAFKTLLEVPAELLGYRPDQGLHRQTDDICCECGEPTGPCYWAPPGGPRDIICGHCGAKKASSGG